MGKGSITLKPWGLALFGAALLLIDSVVKWLTASSLPPMGMSSPHYPYGGIGVFSNFLGIEFAITHATNTGAVGGVFGNYQLPLLIFRLALVVGLLVYLVWFNRKRQLELPLVLIIVGAVGNIIDFFLYRHVIDMLSFRFWGWHYPIFNIADSCIFIGVAWALVLSFVHRKQTA